MLHEYGGAAAIGRRRTLAQQRAPMNERHRATTQRRDAPHRRQGARHVEHLAQVPRLEHPPERQAVLLAVDADKQVAVAHGVSPPRATRSWSIRSAIRPSGSTASTAPDAAAA